MISAISSGRVRAGFARVDSAFAYGPHSVGRTGRHDTLIRRGDRRTGARCARHSDHRHRSRVRGRARPVLTQRRCSRHADRCQSHFESAGRLGEVRGGRHRRLARERLPDVAGAPVSPAEVISASVLEFRTAAKRAPTRAYTPARGLRVTVGGTAAKSSERSRQQGVAAPSSSGTRHGIDHPRTSRCARRERSVNATRVCLAIPSRPPQRHFTTLSTTPLQRRGWERSNVAIGGSEVRRSPTSRVHHDHTQRHDRSSGGAARPQAHRPANRPLRPRRCPGGQRVQLARRPFPPTDPPRPR